MDNPPSMKPMAALEMICLVAVLALLMGGGCAKITGPEPGKPPASAIGKPKPYKVMGQWYTPLADARGFRQKGLASWYGKKFHGRKTSNGEVYDMYGISAAHKTLPLGTYVRVNNLDNGRDLDVRINDRGPFVRGRIIDLSYGAAVQLGVVGPGTARVEIVALGTRVSVAGGQPYYRSVDYYSGSFTFQVGAFTDKGNAERLAATLERNYDNAHITPIENDGQVYYRVRVGRCATLAEADAFEKRLASDGFNDVFTVAE